MNISPKTLALSSLSLLMLSGIATANPKADLDQDGRISKSEFVTEANERFLKTDIDGDGIVTENEREAAKANRHAEFQNEMFTRLDSNGDGFISRSEFDAAAETRREKTSERRDFNGDGKFNREDRDARREKFKQWREGGEGAGFRGEKRRPSGGDRGRMSPDANDDGVITRAEHDAAVEALFTKLDSNGDGFLEKSEGRKKRGKRGGRGMR